MPAYVVGTLDTKGVEVQNALARELHEALPQGGRLPREVDAIRSACAPLAVR